MRYCCAVTLPPKFKGWDLLQMQDKLAWDTLDRS